VRFLVVCFANSSCVHFRFADRPASPCSVKKLVEKYARFLRMTDAQLLSLTASVDEFAKDLRRQADAEQR
jgi:hypothetical protein